MMDTENDATEYKPSIKFRPGLGRLRYPDKSENLPMKPGICSLRRTGCESAMDYSLHCLLQTPIKSLEIEIISGILYLLRL